MSTTGRNDRCRCGSGKKTKRCCGVRSGPSERELAKAFLATHKRRAALQLFGIRRVVFDELFNEMLDLPARYLSLQLRLPRLLSPELEALRRAIDDDDDGAIDEQLEPALSRLDTPEQRAEIARAVLSLVDDRSVTDRVGAIAMVDLASHPSGLMRSGLLQALSVSVGAARTPSGLLVISR